MNTSNVTAIVVTYNRKKLLVECLEAIRNQTVIPEKVIVINNASTDGTDEMFKNGEEFDAPDICCINMPENTGGSGGFYEGLKRVRDEDTDWTWVMDDDTIPEPDCLEKLLAADRVVSQKKGKENTSFYASAVFGVEGELMNVPNVSTTKAENGYLNYYEFLGESIIRIADATFVSLLISKKAILKCGLPCRDYFIWGDDGEYTLRMTHFYGPAYMVGNSIAIHKRFGAKTLSINNFSDSNRIKMYHYYVRNNIINTIFYKKDKCGAVTVIKKLLQALSSIRLISQKHGLLKIRVIWKGTFEGFFQYGKFKKYIEAQMTNS